VKLSDLVGRPSGLAEEILEAHLQRQRLEDQAFGFNSATMRIQGEIRKIEELSGVAEIHRLTDLLPQNPAKRLADIIGHDPFEEALKATRALSEPLETSLAAHARTATENLFSASIADSVFRAAGRSVFDEFPAAAGINDVLGRAFPNALEDIAGAKSIAAGLAQTLEADRAIESLTRAAGVQSELDRALGLFESAMPRSLADAMRALEADSLANSLRWLEQDRIGIGREIFEAATVSEWLDALPDAPETDSDFWAAVWERSKEIGAKYGKPAQQLFLMVVANLIVRILWTYLVHPAIDDAIERYSATPPEATAIERAEGGDQATHRPQSGPPL
jgi:hypothetical protein